MKKHYIILSLKHSTKDILCFWRADDNGYTENPWAAGIYTEEQVLAHPTHYNDGCENVAVELTHDALRAAGLLITPALAKIKAYYRDKQLQLYIDRKPTIPWDKSDENIVGR
jgi:hypothetical protein